MKIKNDTIKELEIFFNKEMKGEHKTKGYMLKIYKNRIKRERNQKMMEAIHFIFYELGVLFFSGKFNQEEINKLTYGFEKLGGKKELWSSIKAFKDNFEKKKLSDASKTSK